MRTPKKIWKSIAKKFKNRKGTTTAKGAAIEELRTFNMPEDVEEVKVEVKEQTNVTETDIQPHEDINENSEDLQLVCESNKETQNNSTTVEPTSVDRADRPSSAEPHFDSRSGNTIEEKSSKKAIQPIVAGVVGAALLVSSIVAYILKMYAIAVVGGIVGLACVSYALYNAIKPNTKLEKIENVEQPIIQSSLNPT